MLVIVLQQCHKESEERWKRLSRQIIDAVLPVLSRQQVSVISKHFVEIIKTAFYIVNINEDYEKLLNICTIFLHRTKL